MNGIRATSLLTCQGLVRAIAQLWEEGLMGWGAKPVVCQAEDHSCECLDLALPEVTCQSIAVSSAAGMASTGQSIHGLCASRVEEMVLSKQAGGNHVLTSPQGGSEPGFPSSGGILAPWGSKSIWQLGREDRPNNRNT